MKKPLNPLRFLLVISIQLVLGLSASIHAQESEDVTIEPADFAAWLERFRIQAAENGISQPTIEAALDGLTGNPRVIELDRRQPEFTITYEKYLTDRTNAAMVREGKRRIAEHRAELDLAAERYGVPGRVIAAIWGIETRFGRFTGKMSVVRSLATLAYDPRRSEFFTKELLNALKIIDEGHISAADMEGSWAGAMGQGQFMPSSFLAYARDLDGDGRADIWNNEGDAFASIANYLKSFGWDSRYTWGRQVRRPADIASKRDDFNQQDRLPGCQRALKQHSRPLKLARWDDLGFRRLNGRPLPIVDLNATLVEPAEAEGPAYLTYQNYRAILRYNCSNYYALTVGHLADRLRY